MDNKFDIGVAVVNYTQDGKPSSAGFEPTMKVNVTEKMEFLKQLVATEEKQPAKEAETTRYNAEMLLATWFNKMNQIELADRNEYKISSEVVACEKYENGNIKFCKVKFSFEKIQTTS